MSQHPTHIIIKLDQPVGPDDAQDVAQHVVDSLEFADVEWARPAVFDGLDITKRSCFVLTGEEVSWSP